MTDTPMTPFFAEPADVLLVRDGRPFSAGDDHLATGPFPPPPTVLYGALRSAFLAAAGADFRKPDFGLSGAAADALGTTTTPGALTLTGATLARRVGEGRRVQRLWPVPLHVLRRKDSGTEGARAGEPFVRLAPADLPAGSTNPPAGLQPLVAAPHPASTFYERTSGYLTDAGLAAVLDGGVPAEGDLVAAAELFRREPRTQVSLRGRATADDGEAQPFTGTAQDGQLFTVDFVRMVGGAGLLLTATGLPPGDAPHLLRLGGESRATTLEPVETAATDPSARAAAADGRVAIVLTTACPSPDGWRPEALGADGVRLPGGRVVGGTLVGAAVGRHETIGGWDVAARRPKPARRAAPAGSVYFLEGVSDTDALFSALDGQSLCVPTADRAQGLGLVRLGRW